MTQRDIRDIAAYWGCPVQVLVGGIVQRDLITVNWSLLKDLAFLSTVGIEHKVCLRPIASLTDEEVRECALIDAGGQFLYGDVYKIDRRYGGIDAYYGNGASVELCFDGIVADECVSHQLPAIISYLQFIAIYVPGTIDEKYVNIIT